MVCRIGVVVLATALIYLCSVLLPPTAVAMFDEVLDTTSDLVSGVGAKNWQYDMGIKKFVNSYTSYQFPNPFPPNQDPLSRLEFPIDQWFLGGEYDYIARNWSLEFQSWMNLNEESRTMMQDSDWDNENQPFQKTVFSESKCRLNSGWLFDLKLVLKPEWSIFRTLLPIGGLRYQSFSFTTHDGSQVGLDGHSLDLPGDGINFDQTFYHGYLGMEVNTKLNTSGVFRSVPSMDLKVSMDYGLATARNEDLHLLRSGRRITNENTSGHCWHAEATASFYARRNIKGLLNADFKRIITNGGHQLTNSVFNIDFSFDGAMVWSDQLSVTAATEFIF